LTSSEYRPVAGTYESGSRPSIYMKCEELTDQLYDYYLLKRTTNICSFTCNLWSSYSLYW